MWPPALSWARRLLPRSVSTTVSGWGIACSSTNPNAVQVTETATITTLFAQLLGKSSLTVSASSTASKGRPEPYNVAVILDTTPSMTTTDSSCSNKTQLQCAVEGVQSLLKGLEPSMDNVSLFTFPNMDVNDVSNEYNCAGSYNQSVPPYTFPYSNATTLTTMPYYYETTSYSHGKTVTTPHTENVTYQIVDYSNNYKTSDTATTLNTSSNLVKAVGGKSGCSSMGTGYENTYFAGAVYAAQASLVAEQKAYPNYLNAMILLSDGNATAKVNNANGDYSPGSNDMISNKTESNSTNWATSGGSYGSWVGECSQAVDAAKAASTAGTVVYTIAYGSPTTSSSANCASDRNSAASHYKITPCQTLQQMSTNYNSGDTTHFFSDTSFGSDTGCLASGNNSGVSAISQIYSLIASQLSGARLIPNGTP